MRRFLPALFISLSLSAQTSAPALDKPPQDVDDALRARIKQFYDYHVARKYRQSEQLIAEESKDDFYVLSKPELQSYTIGNVEYSEKFTKAKVVIVGAMPVLLPMAGGKIMDMPFASYWKIENGLWCWYYNKEAARHTPFGDIKAPTDSKPGPAPTSLPTAPNVTIAGLQSALRIDRTRVELAPGKPQAIKVTNTLPGPASLSVVCPIKPLAETGVIAKFDKTDLKANDAATLTFDVDPNAPTGVVPIQITVMPTNQILNLTVRIIRE
jgi:hypothetical protein